jgi:hypothetical protein
MIKLNIIEELYEEYMQIAEKPKTAGELLAEIKNTVDEDGYGKMVVFVDGTADTVAIANEIKKLSILKGGDDEGPLDQVEDPAEELCALVDPKSLPKNGIFIFGDNSNLLNNKYWTVQDLVDALSLLDPEEIILYSHQSEMYCGDGDLNNSLSVIEYITTDLKYIDEAFLVVDDEDNELCTTDYNVGLVIWVFTIISNITV